MSYLSSTDIIVFAFGVFALLLWMAFYFRGKAYQKLFVGLDSKDYPMGELYFVGYAVTLALNVKYKDKQTRKLRKELGVIYDPMYTDYYLRVIYSMQYTMALTVLALAAPMYFVSANPLLFALILFGAVGVYYYYGVAIEDKIRKRGDEMLSDFSEVVSKLALLVNSGMILSAAWERVAFSGDSTIYMEMRKCVEEMHNGMSMSDALYVFGQRSLLPEVKKFSSTLIQGINQGNRELAPMIRQQSKEMWELKKQLARRAGELASNKLLIPMCITFIGILIMVIIPIFSNIGV